MKGGSTERQASFKKGIEDKTRAREADQISIRKQKRSEKLIKRRQVAPQAAPAAAAPVPFEKLLSRFNKRALLVDGDLTQLQNLDILVHQITDHNLNAYYEAITAPNLIPFLIKLLATERKNELVLRTALGCVINLSGTKSIRDLELTSALLKAGMFDMIGDHIRAYHAGKHQFMSDFFHSGLWELVINVVISCPEAGGMVVRSGLFGFYDPGVGSADAGVVAPFNQDMLRIMALNNMTPEHRKTMLYVMTTLMCSIFRYHQEGVAPPLPWLFLLCCWTFIIQLLKEIQPRAWEETSKMTREIIRNTIRCICHVLRSIYRLTDEQATRERMGRMFTGLSPVDVMRKLCVLIPICHQVLDVKLMLVECMVVMCALPFPLGMPQKFMRECGGITQLILATQSREAAIRQNGFLWAGNYMADGVQYVTELMQAGVLDSIKVSIRNDIADVSHRAVYALLTMFVCCDEVRKEFSPAGEIANGLMGTLVVQHKMLGLIAPYIGLEGKVGLTVDVLKSVLAALKWNRQVTLNQLRNHSDATSRLEHVISDLKGDRNGEIYDLAVKIEDIIEGGGGGRDEDGGFVGVPLPGGFGWTGSTGPAKFSF